MPSPRRSRLSSRMTRGSIAVSAATSAIAASTLLLPPLVPKPHVVEERQAGDDVVLLRAPVLTARLGDVRALGLGVAVGEDVVVAQDEPATVGRDHEAPQRARLRLGELLCR